MRISALIGRKRAEKRDVMEEKELDKVAAFDTLFTTNHIQMCKVLLSYLPAPYQSTLAVYIKLAELNYTFSFLKRHPRAYLGSFPPIRAASDNSDSSISLNGTNSWNSANSWDNTNSWKSANSDGFGNSWNGINSDGFGNSTGLNSENFTRLIDDISPYLSYTQRSRFQQMKNMMQNMKNLQEMMEMVEMLKSLFPEGMGGFGDNNSGNSDSQGNFDGNNGFSGADFFSILSGMGNMSNAANAEGMANIANMLNMSGSGFDPALLSQAMQMMNPGETATDTETELKSEPENE